MGDPILIFGTGRSEAGRCYSPVKKDTPWRSLDLEKALGNTPPGARHGRAMPLLATLALVLCGLWASRAFLWPRRSLAALVALPEERVRLPLSFERGAFVLSYEAPHQVKNPRCHFEL